jgi:DNA sulfur modification protein DndD
MKLASLTLKDFRPFAGVQTLDFAASKDRNVTIVYGANGGGKTTLLNAFLWVLYDEFTSDLEHPELIINNQVWDRTPIGEYAEASVSLEFEHEGLNYQVIRSAQADKISPDDPQHISRRQLHFRFTDKDGKNYEKDFGEDAINQILPKRLKNFFFFNGERIENLVKQAAYEEIEEAIKTLLGLEQIERAFNSHLPEAKKRLQADLAKFGNDKTKELVHRQEQAAKKRAEATEGKEQAIRNHSALCDEQAAIEDQLRTFASTAELQKERDQLQRDFNSSKTRETAARKEIASLINELGYLAFLSDLANDVKKICGDLRSRGEIPTPIKRQFVEDLLAKKICICGTKLIEGGEPHRHVAEWRVKAGIQEVEESWLTLSANVSNFSSQTESLRQRLVSCEERISLESEDRRIIEEKLSEVSSKLGNLDYPDIQLLESRRLGLLNQIRSEDRRIITFDFEIQGATKEDALVESELRKAEIVDRESILARRRADAVSDVRDLLGSVLELRKENVRLSLSDRIKKVYKTISFKPYIPELNENFSLALNQIVGDKSMPVAKSTAENQILSLSFVGALASLARDRDASGTDRGGILDTVGGIYPIVMDSPFGSMDENYRREVASALPILSPQIVVFVSKAQGQGAVAEELRDHVGATYVISYNSSKEEGENEMIEVGGVTVPYIAYGTENDYAQLVLVGKKA